jgi:GxxExxY protein
MLKHKDLSDKIIRAFYKVYNELGHGFLERVYQNAMVLALKSEGLEVVTQKPLKVYYQERIVGDYFADIMVNDVIIVELKAATALAEAHQNQLRNYLKASGIEIGLLMNFGEMPTFKRLTWFNNELREN